MSSNSQGHLRVVFGAVIARDRKKVSPDSIDRRAECQRKICTTADRTWSNDISNSKLA